MMLDANLWHYLLKYKNCAIFLMIFVFCCRKSCYICYTVIQVSDLFVMPHKIREKEAVMEYYMNRCWLNNVFACPGLSTFGLSARSQLRSAMGTKTFGLSARGSRVLNPLEYLYYSAPVVSHCLDCRVKPGKRNVVFFGQKVCPDFRVK
jgi:hypothetical protein